MSHDAQRQPAQTCAPEEPGRRPEGSCPVSDLHEDTPRAALFRRAIVEPAERAARARRQGDAPRFASRPPPLAATWRARCGSRLGFARRVPLTPRRPPVVGARAPIPEIGAVAFIAHRPHGRRRLGVGSHRREISTGLARVLSTTQPAVRARGLPLRIGKPVRLPSRVRGLPRR